MLVMFEETVNVISKLQQTINYSDLYALAKKYMNIPSQLLETVVMAIGEEVHQQYSWVSQISVSLKKVHPPIDQMEGSVGVTWHKKY